MILVIISDEMYVLSATNRRVSIELLGKDKIQSKVSKFEEMTGASLSFLGVSSSGPSGFIVSTIPSELGIFGRLFSCFIPITVSTCILYKICPCSLFW